MEHEELIFAMIKHELDSQLLKWGEQNHASLYWLGIITEELGEVAKEMIQESTRNEYTINELVHTAACCINAIDSLMRNHK